MSYWAKLYTEILDDPKLMRAEREGMRHLSLLPWLIVYAKRADDDGRITVAGRAAAPADIARSIPCITTKQVASSLRELLELGILIQEDDGVLRLSAWSRRQDARPSDAPSAHRLRQKRYRDRKRAERLSRADVSRDVTPSVTRDGASATRDAPERDVHKDIVTEKDQETSPSSPSCSGELYEPPVSDSEIRALSDGRISARPILMSEGFPGLPLSAVIVLAGTCQTRPEASAVEEEMRALVTTGTLFKGQLITATLERFHDACATTIEAMRGQKLARPWAFTLSLLSSHESKAPQRKAKSDLTKQERGRRNLQQAIQRRNSKDGN